jgi:hypothetical protein
MINIESAILPCRPPRRGVSPPPDAYLTVTRIVLLIAGPNDLWSPLANWSVSV